MILSGMCGIAPLDDNAVWGGRGSRASRVMG